jgi:hypothetical protein
MISRQIALSVLFSYIQDLSNIVIPIRLVFIKQTLKYNIAKMILFDKMHERFELLFAIVFSI